MNDYLLEEAARRTMGSWDSVAGTIATISFEHVEVHDGHSYHCSVSSADLGAETGDHLQITLTTDATKIIHIVADAYSSGESLFTIREAPTGGVAGTTAVTAYNRRRDSQNTTSVTALYQATTVGTNGTVLVNTYIGAGNNKVAGESRARSEWMLKPSTKYTFRVYATGAITAILSLDWYEHTSQHKHQSTS